jgi:hypothetical protein
MRKPRSGRYAGAIQTVPLTIKNAPREEFRKQLEAVPFLAFEVESLADGRTICITKPGGKNVFGQMKVHDFMVWVYKPITGDRWRISHSEIFEDIQAKLASNTDEAKLVIDALRRVHDGEDPSDILASTPTLGRDLPGEPAELLLKAYKWIWGQEDCNYPTGAGRSMSMNGLMELVQ